MNPLTAVACMASTSALLLTSYALRSLTTPTPTPTPTVSKLYTYPLKGGRGCSVESATLTRYGLAGDRTYMLVSAPLDTPLTGQWTFLTPRQLPLLATIQPVVDEKGRVTRLEWDNQSVDVPLSPGPPVDCTLWGDAIQGFDCGDDVAQWLTERVNAARKSSSLWAVRLLWAGEEGMRDGKRVLEDDSVDWVSWPEGSKDQVQEDIESGAFSDGFPMLVVSESAIGLLNDKLETVGHAAQMIQFRPNVVLAGLHPHEEDTIQTARIGSTSCVFVKPCARCSVPTINPQTGIRSPDAQPSKTLRTYRAAGGEVFFGMNVVHTTVGATLSVGDSVELGLKDPYPGPNALQTLTRFAPRSTNEQSTNERSE